MNSVLIINTDSKEDKNIITVNSNYVYRFHYKGELIAV